MERFMAVPNIFGPFLPNSTRELLGSDSEGEFELRLRHAGLQLDKYSRLGLDRNRGVMESQKQALLDVTEVVGDSSMLTAIRERRQRMLNSTGACTRRLLADGPLTLHLARAGAWENAGLCLHPVYGFAFLPGSGIKGLARSWAETVWAKSQPDTGAAWKRIEELFGYSAGSEAYKAADKRQDGLGWRPASVGMPEGDAAGRLVFHDAWPCSWPRLEVDVANNHHPSYYAGDGAPGDWEDPTLIYFLCVAAGTGFDFAVADRRPRGDTAAEDAMSWLVDALQAEGAGAKTAAGYGRFILDSSSGPSVPSEVVHRDFTLKSVSPAFLAGSQQAIDDCVLRGATLRGLLRWWWRAMYAGKVGQHQLRALEAAVWGDAQTGSPLRIAVRVKAGSAFAQYYPSGTWLRNRGITTSAQPGGAPRTTLGLHYASYGMKEKQRCFQPEGTLWQLTVTARKGVHRADDGQDRVLQSSALLRQASAALWLLCRYGGVGSKSRKGFGSLGDISVDGIASIADCNALAVQFIGDCGVTVADQSTPYAPALEHAIELPEVSTSWDNAWFACHQLGSVLQNSIKSLPKDDRIALGLPRGRSRQPAGSVRRHASPALWSLTRDGQNRLGVRVLAFPSPKLPSFSQSRAILGRFMDKAKQELEQCRNQPPQGGRAARIGTAEPPRQQHRPTSGIKGAPRQGTRVAAELLEKRTKKGGWRARHNESGLAGPVQDEIPGDRQPGQVVELHVHSVNADRAMIAFRWQAQSKKAKQAPGTRHAKGARYRGGKRR